MLTDNRIKFSAKFGFYLWISGATKIWLNIKLCDLFTNIFLSPMSMRVTLENHFRGRKQKSISGPLRRKTNFDKFLSSENCQNVVCKSLNLTWLAVVMRRMSHCEGSQSKLLFWRVQKLRLSLLYLTVWVVWSVALFYCQIFQPNLDPLANSRVLPPNKTSKSCHLLFQCFAAAIALFGAWHCSVINVKWNQN